LTSRNFENDRRSRDARRANVTPIRGGSHCGAQGAETCTTSANHLTTRKRTRLFRARVVKGRETEKARAGRHGSAQHSPRPCRLPRRQARAARPRVLARRIRRDLPPDNLPNTDKPDRERGRSAVAASGAYLTSTWPPASSSFVLAFSASSLEAF